MAAPTPGEISAIRAHVGSEPDDANLGERFDRLGSVELVAEEVIRTRLADLVAGEALKVDVHGDYSEDATGNVEALTKALTGLSPVTGSTVFPALPTLTMGQLLRPDQGR